MNKRSLHSHFVPALVLALLCVTAAASWGPPAAAAVRLQADPPDPVVTEPLLEWALADPMLYWADRCVPGPDVAASPRGALDHYPLRRMPLNGGARRTLDASHDTDCLNYQYITADASAVYFFNADAASIQTIPLAQPGQPPVTLASSLPDVSTELLVRDGFVYFGTFSRTIQRVSTAGGAPELVANSTASPRDLDISGNRLYWVDSAGVWLVTLPCNGCTPVQYSDNGGKWLFISQQGFSAGGGIYRVVGGGFNQPDRVLTQIPIINGVRDITVYTGPVNYRIGDLSALYQGFPFGLSFLYWSERFGGSQDFVRRHKPNSEGADIIAQIDGTLDHRVRIHSGDVYFARIDNGNEAILKLPFDAAALVRDARAANLEVTQAIQNLDNGVPLVADKPTFARVYGDQIDGDLKSSVEAWLEGYRNGSPLPGSPLAASNGQQQLETGGAFDRTGATAGREGWLFALPGSWDDDGAIELRAVVDPHHSFTDPVRANNVLTGTFTFNDEPDPCLFFWPVETHAPLPHYSDPSFWENIDRLESIWPVDAVDIVWMGEPIRELEACLDWDLHCWGPWELDQGWELTNFPPDKDRLIFKLMLRHTISTLESPFFCDDFGSVHTVGMVHGDTNTGGTNGFANFLIGASWVKFEEINTGSSRQWNQPTSGSTLAQELTHNFWRYHVGCLPEEDSFFGLGDWPYTDRCKLDDRSLTAASTHFGFDPLTHDIIPPDIAGDYMTYRSSRWVSDYTFKDVQDIFGTIFDANAASADTGEEMILVTGVYESVANVGRLFYSYLLPDTMLSDSTTGTPPETPIAHQHGVRDAHEIPQALVRLRGPDGSLLAEHAVDLVAPDTHDADYVAYVFVTQIAKPASEVGHIELVVDDQVMDVRTPSANAPVIEILSPTADATLGDAITLRWRATDADDDELLFSVNYSPDDGVTWLPLTTEYPGDIDGDVTSLTLISPETLPGSAGKIAYLRVIGSDGYHTTVAEVGPFTVLDRTPQAIIQAPAAEAWFDANEAILLRGRGFDAEAGALTGSALAWTLDGEPIGSGRQQTVMGLAPGVHAAGLQVTDSAGQTTTQTAAFQVLPLSIPSVTSTPAADGRCNDSAYTQAVVVTLPVYDTGGQAMANLARRGDDLLVCLTGLQRSEGEAISTVSLRLDADNSGDTLAQADDYRFTLGEDGTPAVHSGDGAGAFDQAATADFTAEVAATDATWSAEFRIRGEALALWQTEFGLALDHVLAGTPDEAMVWPRSAQAVQPPTCADVANDAVPFLQAMVPLSATLGAQQVVLAFEGRRFGPNTTLLVNGIAQSTVISSATQLTATLDGALLQTAGTLSVTAVSTPTGGFESNPLPFTLYNPVPSLTALAPNLVDEDDATIVITGDHFVEGAIALVNGQARPTRRLSAQTLEMDLDAVDLAYAHTVGVTVLNPEPRLQASNTLPLVIDVEVYEPVFLPLLQR